MPEGTLDALPYARATLLAGFTTVRNLGAGNFIDVGLRNGIRRGKAVGPRILTATSGLGATGGVLSPNNNVQSPQLAQAELDAVVDEAHARGRKVAAHAHASVDGDGPGARRAGAVGPGTPRHTGGGAPRPHCPWRAWPHGFTA